ncbi:MAG: NAD(P)/FAD-dependent oxidoreductase [Chthoniobacteraceae bacterium]
MGKQIVIIGAGVIGLAAAYYSAQRGHRVTVLERNPEARDGCSFGNNGMIVPSHFIPLAAPGMVALGLKWMWNPRSPFYIKPRLDADLIDWGLKFWRSANARHVARSAPLIRDLSFASRACFEELGELPGEDFGLTKRGLLMLCKTEHALEEEGKVAEAARQIGVPAEVLDAKETAALDPGVTMDVAGAVYFPKDCHLSPARLMAALKRELGRLGVQFSWETEVTGFVQRERGIEAVQTSRGDFPAEEVVLCTGAWSQKVARELQLRLPMQAGTGDSLSLPNPRQLPELCSICTEARIAVTPMHGALRFGGTMEISGLSERINPERVRGIIDGLQRYFPEFRESDFEGIEPWRGLRPCSPDGLPYLGRSGRIPNLVVATGHGMMGISLGPITGKLVSQLVCGEKPEIDLALLSPDRWARVP